MATRTTQFLERLVDVLILVGICASAWITLYVIVKGLTQ